MPHKTREARRAWYHRTKTKRRARMRGYYRRHRRKYVHLARRRLQTGRRRINRLRRARYKRCREHIRAQWKARYRKRRKLILLQQRLYRARHPLQFKRYSRRTYAKTRDQRLNYLRGYRPLYRKRFPEKLLEHDNRRRARKRKARLGIDRAAYRKFVRAAKLAKIRLCYYCGTRTTQKNRTIDHAIPICRKGKDSVENLRVACVSCNCSKGYKTEKEFIKWKQANRNRKRVLLSAGRS
jgi:5-methylcytosine-specific restriction endonuclease McrA